MTKIYIETSAANYFLDNFNGAQAEATRRFQLSKGRHWFISTTVLWEVLQIQEKKDLDACLFLGSYLFHDRLLKSAAEIGIEYLEKGMPEYMILDSPFTNSTLGHNWQRACKDKSYSFYLDDSPFTEATKEIKRITRHIRYFAGDKDGFDNLADEEIKKLANVLAEIYQVHFTDTPSNLVVQLRRVALLTIFIQLCLGLDIARNVIEEYWLRIKISDPIDRLTYLLEKFPDIASRGPFWNIANAILIQCEQLGKNSRGAFHDGLHSIYLPFVDVFLTNDNHFKALRDNALKEYRDSLYNKIFHLSEVEIFAVGNSNQ